MAERIRFDAFGTNIYSWGLVHLGTRNEELACGASATSSPPMTVHKDEPVTCFECLALQVLETDEAFRTRIANKYGMWGSYLSHVIECSGASLDEAAKHVELERLVYVINNEANDGSQT